MYLFEENKNVRKKAIFDQFWLFDQSVYNRIMFVFFRVCVFFFVPGSHKSTCVCKATWMLESITAIKLN